MKTSKLSLLLYLIGTVVLVSSIMMYYFGIGTLGRDLDKAFFYGLSGIGIMAVGYFFNENKNRIQQVEKLEERIDEVAGIVVDEKYEEENENKNSYSTK